MKSSASPLTSIIVASLLTLTIAAPRITLRSDATKCLDSVGADQRTAVKVASCDAASTSQAFFYDPSYGSGSYGFVYLNDTSAKCDDQGPPCCLAHLFGINDVVGIGSCSGVTDLTWTYDNQTGQLLGRQVTGHSLLKTSACMTAIANGAQFMPCNTSDPNQSWSIQAGIGPHGATSCKVKGCTRPTHVLPGECSCYHTCAEEGTCCSDYQEVCEAESCAKIGCAGQGITCSCTDYCERGHDCCPDYRPTCKPQQDTCAILGCTHSGATCSCGPNCTHEGNCCSDHAQVCKSSQVKELMVAPWNGGLTWLDLT